MRNKASTKGRRKPENQERTVEIVAKIGGGGVEGEKWLRGGDGGGEKRWDGFCREWPRVRGGGELRRVVRELREIGDERGWRGAGERKDRTAQSYRERRGVQTLVTDFVPRRRRRSRRRRRRRLTVKGATSAIISSSSSSLLRKVPCVPIITTTCRHPRRHVSHFLGGMSLRLDLSIRIKSCHVDLMAESIFGEPVKLTTSITRCLSHRSRDS